MISSNDIKLDLSWISKYRSEIFGISIIAIIIFHFRDDYINAIGSGLINIEQFSAFNKAIAIFLYLCVSSVGVEIFTILSGVGLYYSFSKNDDIKSFYAKRFKRVLIPYVLVATVFWLVKDVTIHHLGVGRAAQDFFFVTFFTEGVRTIWFIGFISVMYLAFPLIYKAIYSGKGKNIRAAAIIVLIICGTVVLYYANPQLYTNIEVAITRIPAFILGVLLGYYVKKGIKISWKVAVIGCLTGILFGAFGAIADVAEFASRYFDVLYGLALLLVIASFLHLIRNFKLPNRAMRFVGNISLEIYILHVVFRNLMIAVGFEAYNGLQYLIMICISIIASVGLKGLTDMIKHKANDIF